MPPNHKKRKANQSPNSRLKKKHKNLGDICDKPPPFIPNYNNEENSQLRRSSRNRKPPEILDSSPVRKKPTKNEIENNSKKKMEINVKERIRFEKEEAEGRRKRLRSGGNEKESILMKGKDCKNENVKKVEICKELDAASVKIGTEVDSEVDGKLKKGSFRRFSRKGRFRKRKNIFGRNESVEKVDNCVKEGEECRNIEQAGEKNEAEKVGNDVEEQDFDLLKTHVFETENSENTNIEVRQNEADNGNGVRSEKNVKETGTLSPVSDNKVSGSRVKEGRRCGLCGRGTDGKPPKKLVKESVGSDDEACEGSSASEEPNYDVWDGFGDESGWLGRLLGPIHDRFGIARIWVHQHCAVWSPEVYFAGLGCLKNVRAALCRGRALKCSRCGRPGATIGCRVDRCPKTYHLPCSRAEGCIFDHKKFLIACHDHQRLFQPQGSKYSHQIRKRKAKKLKLEIRKHSNDALRKDLEAEEKWFENCGEDEEFLKREGKRLNRDIQRIAPTYIGGSSENEKLFQGWESVAGLQNVIQCMKEVVILPLLYPDFFSNMGLTPPRGVLLHGYPGTGKTLVVRALIGACSQGDQRIAYFARKGADCLGKYVGDAERQLRLLFQEAEKSQPSIIFFDEIDGLAPVRSRNQDQTHSSVVSTLLSLMDGLKSRGSVIVIGATNRPDSIDPALRRPGRFDREIYFPLPSEKDRSAILSLHTQSWVNPLSGTLLSWIANQTVGYAGADLQALCTQAAMNALKRNFPLKELLYSAEKGSLHGRHPSIPSLMVEECDWLAALAHAPPPCSRREAGIAANDVVSSPLPGHLLPCLIEPLLLLLVSLHNDERIWLPPIISKAANAIKIVVHSSLEQRRLPIASWQSHLHHLIHQERARKELEEILSRYGLIGGNSFVLDDVNDAKFDSFTLRHNGMNIHKIMTTSLSGFRALITGSSRSGQQHLANCILNGFTGNVEIQKVNLATISQEGHGDLLRGLTYILSKCRNLERYVIYMPRLDLWAINDNLGEDAEDGDATTEENGNSISGLWNSFVEQVDSVCASASFIILATCEIQSHNLPLGIKRFFTKNTSHASSISQEHTIPRFVVQIDGNFDRKLVINSFAAKLSEDLVRNFIHLLHQKTHSGKSQDKTKATIALEVNSDTQKQSISNDVNRQCVNSDSFPRTLPNRTTMSNSTLAIAAFGYQILRYPQFAELCWITSKLREGPTTDINGPWKGWPFNSCVMHGSNSRTNNKERDNSSVVRGLIAVGLLSYKGVYASVNAVAIEVRKVLEILVGRIRSKLLVRKDRYQYLRILSQAAYLEDMVNSWAYKFQSSPTNNPSTESNTKLMCSKNLPIGKNNFASQSCASLSPNRRSAEEQDPLLKENAKSTAPQEPLLKKNSGTTEEQVPLPKENSAEPITENGRCIDAELVSEKSCNTADLAAASKKSCLYICCSGCLHALYVLAHDILSQCYETHSCSTIDDIDNIFSSCSVNLLSAFRKHSACAFGSGGGITEYDQTTQLEHCACPDVCNEAFKNALLAKDCKFHLRNNEGNAMFREDVIYLFRDGVLVSLKPEKDDEFHCRYDKLCLYFMVDVLRAIRKPLD